MTADDPDAPFRCKPIAAELLVYVYPSNSLQLIQICFTISGA